MRTLMDVDVGPEHLNADGLLDSASLLPWVQKIVVHHWERNAPALAISTTLWVAARHAIEHFRAVCDPATLAASTYIREIRGVRAVFRTTFSRDEVKLAVVDSTWICIDSASGRPKTIGGDIRGAFEV